MDPASSHSPNFDLPLVLTLTTAEPGKMKVYVAYPMHTKVLRAEEWPHAASHRFGA